MSNSVKLIVLTVKILIISTIIFPICIICNLIHIIYDHWSLTRQPGHQRRLEPERAKDSQRERESQRGKKRKSQKELYVISFRHIAACSSWVCIYMTILRMCSLVGKHRHLHSNRSTSSFLSPSSSTLLIVVSITYCHL